MTTADSETGGHLTWRVAIEADAAFLAAWNYQMLRDQDHRNSMTVEQLEARMRQWLSGEYRAILFTDAEPVGYALFKQEEKSIFLRHFFIRRDKRRIGLGRAAFSILRGQVWPGHLRLTIDVLSHNQQAIAFWRSVGFQEYSLTFEIMPP